VHPRLEYHLVQSDANGVVTSVEPLTDSDIRINGGYFVFRNSILDDIRPDEELVVEPFARLIARGELLAYRHDGFWEPMDTIKDKQRLDSLLESGRVPWQREPVPDA
jgi:glucose-1-phosphate cytidylyltransferase